MARKPLGYSNKYSFECDTNNNGLYERHSFSSRFDERRRSNNGTTYFETLPGLSRASSTESLLDDLSIRATSMFQSLDPYDRGFIKPEDLFSLNSDLKEDELMEVFKQLDSDNDGSINLEDFKAGLRLITKTVYKKNMERRRSRVNSQTGWSPINIDENKSSTVTDRGRLASIACSLDEEISLFSCGERISDFYENISRNNPEVAEQFNDLVDLMVNDIKDLMTDKYFLNASFQKEKAVFEKQIRQLEEEFESQISHISKTETKSEAEKIEKEFRLIMQKKEEEINNLKGKLSVAEEISRSVTTVTSHTSIELKEEMTKLQKENNNLQVQLCASQTECAMIHSEQVTVKQELQERIAQLHRETESLHSYENDWQNLTKQLQMLRDINRRLKDTNDSLRSAVEASPCTSDILRKISINSASNKSFNNSNHNLLYCDPAYLKSQRLRGFEKFESCQDEHGDSGLSTLRDVTELESEMQPLNMFTEAELIDISTDDYIEAQTHSLNSLERTMMNRPSGFQRDLWKDSNSSNNSHRKQKSKDKRRYQQICGRDFNDRDISDSEYPTDNYDFEATETILKDVIKSVQTFMPERVYKIVFAGDASVGKSTFIMRLCSDTFVSDCKTTIGIDFHNKAVTVDNKVIGLQLWDTAGQERFRSMTANYFRKADGVFLLYDCTYQESFIHVRDWVETIKTAAGDDILIVLISNKCDLVGRYKDEGRKVVSSEMGMQLAKENKLIFTEASAKNGHNIMSTVEDLARLLARNEDIQTSKAEKNLKSSRTPQSSKSSCCK